MRNGVYGRLLWGRYRRVWDRSLPTRLGLRQPAGIVSVRVLTALVGKALRRWCPRMQCNTPTLPKWRDVSGAGRRSSYMPLSRWVWRILLRRTNRRMSVRSVREWRHLHRSDRSVCLHLSSRLRRYAIFHILGFSLLRGITTWCPMVPSFLASMAVEYNARIGRLDIF